MVIKTLDSDPELDLDLDPELDPDPERIRIDLKCWIRISIESNSDSQHCFHKLFCSVRLRIRKPKLMIRGPSKESRIRTDPCTDLNPEGPGVPPPYLSIHLNHGLGKSTESSTSENSTIDSEIHQRRRNKK